MAKNNIHLYVLFKSTQHNVSGLNKEEPKEESNTSNLGDGEDAIIRYNFEMKKIDNETQKEYLQELYQVKHKKSLFKR